MKNVIGTMGVVMVLALAAAGCLSPPTAEVGETQQAICPEPPECPPCYHNAGFGGCSCAKNSCPTGQACDPATEQCKPTGGCAAGWADCDGNSANGCETPITTTANCGGCGRACATVGNGSAACVAGRCFYACTNNAAPVCM